MSLILLHQQLHSSFLQPLMVFHASHGNSGHALQNQGLKRTLMAYFIRVVWNRAGVSDVICLPIVFLKPVDQENFISISQWVLEFRHVVRETGIWVKVIPTLMFWIPAFHDWWQVAVVHLDNGQLLNDWMDLGKSRMWSVGAETIFKIQLQPEFCFIYIFFYWRLKCGLSKAAGPHSTWLSLSRLPGFEVLYFVFRADI